MAVKTESSLLNFIRKKSFQNGIRVGKLDEVRDAIESGAVADEGTAILPAGFHGSPRHMLQEFDNAMAVVRRYGKPHLFLTFTCNRKWPEITRELLDHPSKQDPNFRSDLIGRVFNKKLDRLVSLIKGTKKTGYRGVFGKSRATFQTQQRGNPMPTWS